MLSRKIFSQIKINPFNITKRFFAFKPDSLKNVLKSEIAHEETNYTPVDKKELNEFYQTTKFQFKEFDNSTKMELKKTENNYDIVVNFFAKPPSPQPEQDPNNQEEETNPENLNEFSVRVTKTGTHCGLLAFCTLIENTIEFNSVSYSENVEELIEKVNQPEVYLGPEFGTLDEKLQNEFSEYFSTLGVNSELASFIQVLSVDKDQRLYLQWLKDVNRFI